MNACLHKQIIAVSPNMHLYLYERGMHLNSICLFLTENDKKWDLSFAVFEAAMKNQLPNMFLENPIMQSSA